MILFRAETILASSTSKFGIEIPRVDDEDLKSSESTDSTSLIHCIASVRNCEQVHTSVLNFIFQQAKVAGVGDLSKWRSEIYSRCWSAQFFEESPPLKMTESLADGPDWHLRAWFCSGLPLFSYVDIWSGSSMVVSHGFNSWGIGAEEEACGFAKTFPDIPDVSQISGGPSLRRGDTKESLNIPSRIGCLGNNIGWLVTWEFPLRTDSASWKSLEWFIQFNSFCSSCNLPDNSIIVFWFSMSFRLASVSKVELWNCRNFSISVRFCWWTSRKSICCRHNSSCRIRRSSSARAAWSSWWPTFSQYSAIIICLCSSSKVLICAFELLSPTGFPVLSTILSACVFSENLLWALYVFLVTPKPITDRHFLSPTGFLFYRTRQTMTTDWQTHLPDCGNRRSLPSVVSSMSRSDDGVT